MRIMIVEDDQTLGKAMSASLTYAEFAVDWIGTVAEAQHLVMSENYDAIVLDLGLPDRDGYDLVRHLRGRGMSVPVLILTARDAVEDRVQGLDLGADDYLVKPVAMAELQARLRALIRRSHGRGDPQIRMGRLQMDVSGKRALLDGQAIELSGREWAVLEYLVTHQRRIVSKEQLIQAITGLGQDLSGNAIEAYVHRLRNKLEASGAVIRTVRGLGYMMEDADETAL